ncbi:MAG: DNA-processing protein DprA [bacterium]|nr:DNA-processing protein DprA [bacterium]
MAPTQEEAAAYHALALRAEGNVRTLALLIKEYGSWNAAYQDLRARGIALPDWTAEWEALQSLGIRILLRNDSAFPALLREAPGAPLGLYIKGTIPPSPLHNKVEGSLIIAIVGTRNATAYGLATAKRFAETLGRLGVPIVSGLAYGIDAAAHEGALSANAPTVAVLPCGLDSIYPRAHAKLAERILAADGAIVSEYPPGTTPLPFRFLERNRIVSGLATGVIIIEAPEKSGALVTARMALEQNRDVFVVPGKPNEPQYRGSHALLRDGARIVTSPEDVWEDLGGGPLPAASAEITMEQLPKIEASLLALLTARGPRSIDKLVLESNLEPSAITQALAFLALKDLVIEDGINYCAR